MTPDLSFNDLDLIIAEAEERRISARALATKQKHFAAARDSAERDALLADIRRFEEALIWTTVARVATFRTQECSCCKQAHTIFTGWMIEQRHKRDTTARRLLAGSPVGNYPVRREDFCETVPLCNHCFSLPPSC